ncbi:MAG: glycosyltransferase family 92 protein [Rickettsiaceae bacterium]|nr:glycosyltransferase family 92 protein [Rickettsiaceae bacterium]
MRSFFKYSAIAVACVLAVVLASKIFHLDANKSILNFFARHYFDERYYKSHYPEVKEDAFKHYLETGWKENKNPNSWLDNKFYVNCYLLGNKSDMSPLHDYVRRKISLKNLYTNAKELKKAEKLKNTKYYLALTAIFRDEARFLKEWIEFYRLMGVEHFYLYNHLSSDNYMEILSPYIEEGIVDLVNVDVEVKNLSEWNILQSLKYTEIAKKVSMDVEWLMVVDIDEFLFPTKDKNLVDFLKKYDDYAALSVNWRMFGTSNVKKIPDDKLLIETLKMSGTERDLHVKTIVKPRYARKITPHYPQLLDGYMQVNENYEYFKGPFLPEESSSFVRINHYWSRDYEFFESTRLKRPHNVGGLSADERQKRIDDMIVFNQKISSHYDGSILRFVPALRVRVFNSGLPKTQE